MKQKIIPIVAVLVGLLAFILTNSFIGAKIDELDRKYNERIGTLKTCMAVCAAKDLPSGSTIAYGDLAQTEIFENYAPDDFVAAADVKLLYGRKITTSIKNQKMLSWRNVEGGSPSDQGLAPLVKKNMRAISLPIGGAAGVSGMVQPNDRVDILGTFSFPAKEGKGDELVTMTILQDVTILACGQTLAKQNMARGQQRNTGYGSITIEVTPSEAEVLVFAQQIQGRLTLSLRNGEDLSWVKDLPDVNFQHIHSKLKDLNIKRQLEIRQKRDM